MRIILILITYFLSACSDDPRSSCSGIPDNVSIIDTVVHEGATFHLVHRVAGYYEKVDIIELYTESLTLNACGKLRQDPVYGALLYLDEQHVSRIVLNTHEQSLDIIYAEGSKSLIHLSETTLSLP